MCVMDKFLKYSAFFRYLIKPFSIVSLKLACGKMLPDFARACVCITYIRVSCMDTTVMGRSERMLLLHLHC